MSTEFVQQYTELVCSRPEFGHVALLPWDEHIFGFPVGEYRIPTSHPPRAPIGELREAFRSWTRQNDIRVCAVNVSAPRRDWIAALPHIGFGFVDFTLRADLRRLSAAPSLEATLRIRSATPADLPVLKSIATRAFDAGRYHVDARFPRELAERRYEHWIANAVSEFGSVYAAESEGIAVGFFHMTIANRTANLRLAAIDPALHGSGLGFELYLLMLAQAKGAGASRATATISAGNTGVLNIYTALGFRFSDASAVFHWHATEDLKRHN